MAVYTDVLIVGGGFAGVSVAQALVKKDIETVLVDQKDYFEVTFANLRNLAAPQVTRDKARKKYTDFISGKFIQNRLVELLANKARFEDGTEIVFKRVVIASGSRYPSMPVAKSNRAMGIQERNAEFEEFHRQLNVANDILIVGGGIVGVELAGEIAYSFPDKKVTLAHSRSLLLDNFKKRAQRKSTEQLVRLGVEVVFNRRYKKVDDCYIDQNTGERSDADLVYEAVGTVDFPEFTRHFLA